MRGTLLSYRGLAWMSYRSRFDVGCPLLGSVHLVQTSRRLATIVELGFSTYLVQFFFQMQQATTRHGCFCPA
jgi:hypothetical protein